MLGNEIHILPRPFKPAPFVDVSWVFPNTYEVGMSSLGYQLVWGLMDGDPDLSVRRVFTDCGEGSPAASELIGFTVSWELDYINILNVLSGAGVKLLSSDRDDSEPLVFGGGPVLTANPEPFADFFDVILLGDAEAVVPDFFAAWKEVRELPSRRQRLLKLAAVPGVYVPSLYAYREAQLGGPLSSIEPLVDGAPAQVRKRVFSPPDDYVAHSLMLAPDTAFGDMFLLEVARSCPQECRFCLASYLTRPFRAASVDTLIERIDLGLRHTKKIGLLGPSVTEHPEFERLAAALLERPGTSISVASIRADTIAPLVLEMLVALGQRSVTIALESGSERLRAVMKKNLSEEEIHRAVDMIAASGLSSLKFYGIAGLPGETDDDLAETVRLLSELKKKHKRLKLVFGVSSFVPKAQTPFQWSGRDRKSKEKLEHLRKELARRGIEVRPESPNWSNVQTVLSRGDRRLTPLLLTVAAGSGNLGDWKRALRNRPAGCPDEEFYVYRDIPYDETLPWSHLVDEPRAGMLMRHSLTAASLARPG